MVELQKPEVDHHIIKTSEISDRDMIVINLSLRAHSEAPVCPAKEEKTTSDIIAVQLTTRKRMTIVIFACLGIFLIFLTRLFPSGFYLYFVQKSGFRTIIGKILLS